MKTPKGKPRELAPEGSHQFSLREITDFGTQEAFNSEFEPQRKVQLGLELVGQTTEEGNPIMVYREVTFSSSKKSKMYQMLHTWGQDVEDLSKALGKFGMCTVIHSTSKKTEAVYANVSDALIPLPKGMKPGKALQPLRMFFLDPEEEFDQTTFDSLPQWMQEKIAKSPEYAELKAAEMSKGKKKIPAKKK
jgi:hypothetical protein